MGVCWLRYGLSLVSKCGCWGVGAGVGVGECALVCIGLDGCWLLNICTNGACGMHFMAVVAVCQASTCNKQMGERQGAGLALPALL
jgi:hypothetical protein